MNNINSIRENNIIGSIVNNIIGVNDNKIKYVVINAIDDKEDI